MKIEASANPKRKVLKGVELFYTGTHTDSAGSTEGFAASDLEDMVRNFSILASGDRPALFRPPVGIGHSTAGANVFSGDNRLAAGQVLKIWTEDGEIDGEPTRFLYGDLEVDNQVAEWVEDGNLTSVSAEVDDDPPADLVGAGVRGLMFRRAALLGFSLPALKRLRRMQAATYAEAPKRFLRTMRVVTERHQGRRRVMTFCDVCRDEPKKRTFQEGANMNREQMLAWLTERNVDVSMITPETPDAIIQMLVTLMQELETLKATADTTTTDATATTGVDGGMSSGGSKPKQVTLKYSDLVAQVRHLEQMVRVDRQNASSVIATTRRANVKMFCDQMRLEGRLTPAEVEVDAAGNPLPHTTYAQLLRAADSSSLHTFSDGGKTIQKTEFELQCDAIRKRPAMRFSERVPAQNAGVLTGTKSAAEQAREAANKYADKRLAKLGGGKN